MNRLEYEKTLEALNIDNSLLSIKGKDGMNEAVHYWNNVAIYFSGSYYAVIRGKRPLELANTIYYKYPNNPYQIRVEGGSSDNIASNFDKIFMVNDSEARDEALVDYEYKKNSKAIKAVTYNGNIFILNFREKIFSYFYEQKPQKRITLVILGIKMAFKL